MPEDSPNGQRLLYCLQDDWQVFSDTLGDEAANELLSDIVNWHRRRENPKDMELIEVDDFWATPLRASR